MKNALLTIAVVALLFSFVTTVSSDAIDSPEELAAVDRNLEALAEAAGAALLCEQQLIAAGNEKSANAIRESYDRLHLAAMIIPERTTMDRQRTNIEYFDDLVKIRSSNEFQKFAIDEGFEGCSYPFVREISAYSQEAESNARGWIATKEHSVFMFVVYSVIR